ncbi:DUF1998 domain-containing protein [Streptomyces sp. ID05-26A]|nr:DUF1998 domain-containing protein [Streptomyces sp. ID05-26A]
MDRITHDLRLSETITPFGVGAIVDVRGQSLIAPDTSWWDARYAPTIHCDRLVTRLPAGGSLRQAPSHSGRAAKDTKGLLYWRFPEWRFCERCSRLSRSTGKKNGKWLNECECNGSLVPMRYVAVCTGGSHIQDIPWFKWTHRGGDSGVTEAVRFCRAYKELKFYRSAKHGEGLASIQVLCNGCGRTRSMVDLVTSDALKRDGIPCRGAQPWEPDGTCEHSLVAVQRGATGNYIAERISALQIPEEQMASQEKLEQIRSHVYFSKVVADNGGPQSDMVAGWIADELGVAKEEILTLAGGEGTVRESVLQELKDGEWAAFLKKLNAGKDHSEGDFIVDGVQVPADPRWPEALTSMLEGVGQVHRVREVRALKSFQRHSASADTMPVDFGTDKSGQKIYPAIELFGEGIFLRFEEAQLRAWEERSDVRARADILMQLRNDSEWAHRLDVPEPRFIALHTLSHLLIRRLAFASGYASASLQERIYARSDRPDRTAGVLIYTAAGDAQGTLGGLVRLGRPEKIMPLLLAALDDADVCSNDPVCIECDRQRAAQLNLSACHGCALISETSCETGNRFLDRQLVLGGSDVTGLLDEVLAQIRR